MLLEDLRLCCVRSKSCSSRPVTWLTNSSRMPDVRNLLWHWVRQIENTFYLSSARISGDNLSCPWSLNWGCSVEKSDWGVTVGAGVTCGDIYEYSKYLSTPGMMKHTVETIAIEEIWRFAFIVYQIKVWSPDWVAFEVRGGLIFVSRGTRFSFFLSFFLQWIDIHNHRSIEQRTLTGWLEARGIRLGHT